MLAIEVGVAGAMAAGVLSQDWLADGPAATHADTDPGLCHLIRFGQRLKLSNGLLQIHWIHKVGQDSGGLPRRLRLRPPGIVALVAGLAAVGLGGGWQLRDRAMAASLRQREASLRQQRRQLDEQLRTLQAFRSEYLQFRGALERLGTPPPRPGRGGPLAFGRLTEELAHWNRHSQGNLRTIPLGPPILAPYSLSSGFGYRDDPFWGVGARHDGIDLTAPIGTPIVAAGDGRVISCAPQDGYGLLLEIAHGPKIRTRYAHLDSCQVSAGQVVRRGQLIATVGNTGRSTGPHLHYEVRLLDEPPDPTPFLRGTPLAAGGDGHPPAAAERLPG